MIPRLTNILPICLILLAYLPAQASDGDEEKAFTSITEKAEKQGLDAKRLKKMAMEGKAKGFSDEIIKNALEKDLQLQKKAKTALSKKLSGKDMLGAATDTLKSGYKKEELAELANKWKGKGSTYRHTFRYALMAATALKLRGGSAKSINKILTKLAAKNTDKNDYVDLVDLVARAEKAGKVNSSEAIEMVGKYIEEHGSVKEAAKAMNTEFAKQGSAFPSHARPDVNGKAEGISNIAQPKGTAPGRATPNTTKDVVEKYGKAAPDDAAGTPPGDKQNPKGTPQK